MEKLTYSPSLGKLGMALAKAQLGFDVILNDTPVKMDLKNGGSFSYKYAELDSIMKATRKSLAENELCVTQCVSTKIEALQVSNTSGQPSHVNYTFVTVTTLLLHSSNEFIESSLTLAKATTDSKDVGGLASFAKRIAYTAIVGAIVSDEDEEGKQKTPTASDFPVKLLIANTADDFNTLMPLCKDASEKSILLTQAGKTGFIFDKTTKLFISK